eukprot:8959672-Prorocentrum_lima.AAC.1
MTSSLVGSEMCIRDRAPPAHTTMRPVPQWRRPLPCAGLRRPPYPEGTDAVSYTHLTLPTICSV